MGTVMTVLGMKFSATLVASRARFSGVSTERARGRSEAMPKDLETLNPTGTRPLVGSLRKRCGGNWEFMEDGVIKIPQRRVQGRNQRLWSRGTECQQNEGKWDEAS